MHVQMADEAYCIGPAASAESYLRSDKILALAAETGCKGIHPGYGFLSENASFAQECKEAGVTFIGPPPSAISSMGDKSESKNIMGSSGVPIVPGYHGADQDLDTLKAEAEKCGFPLMIKAVLGGGGKGMRIVEGADQFEEMLEVARAEAMKHFRDDNVLIERYVQRPRHVEVQVFADTHGDAVYLFERDCSLQRRHQKIIEEAPAPGLSAEKRRELGEAAVRAAKAVGYVGAGTVEFIFDTTSEEFFFMEMNTRLQVEHPVTEMVTNTDLVEWQLRVASGEPLPQTQEDISLSGHSFEARIYAENPQSDFLPGSGPLTYLRTPENSPDVRVETGVREGDQVSIHYDPMIAKLVVWGEDRTIALNKLRAKLAEYNIAGLSTNIKFLSDCAAHPGFVAADVTTDFIADHQDDLLVDQEAPVSILTAAGVAAAMLQEGGLCVPSARSTDSSSPWGILAGFRINSGYEARNLTLKYGDCEMEVTVTPAAGGSGNFTVSTGDGEEVKVEACMGPDGAFSMRIKDELVRANVALVDRELNLFTCDGQYTFELPLPDHLLAEEGQEMGNLVRAPMTGKLVKVLAHPGQAVNQGDTLVVLEAMKLEHQLRAPMSGVVERVVGEVGQQVDEGVVLVALEDEIAAEE